MRIVVLALVLSSSAASAQDFAGQWEATPLQIRNTTRSWGSDCPARLPATQTEPGGAVRIAQSGDHLTLSGAVSGNTRSCFSRAPGLRRISSRVQGGTWTIVCRTPEDAAQGESGTYTLRASGTDRITFSEVTEWDWRLRDSRCTASRRATRTFTRAGATPTPTMDPEPTVEPDRPSCTPGAAASVRLSPATSTITPGERVCLRARVVDRAGCTVRGAPIQLRMTHAAGLRGTLEGRCFTAGASAAEAEGEYRIEARSGSLRAQVRVTVQSEDLSGLTARREGDPTSSDLGDAESGSASDLEARALAGGMGRLPLILGGVVGVLLLLGLGLVFAARRRRKTPREPDPGTGDDDTAFAASPTAQASAANSATDAAPALATAPAPVAPAPPPPPKVCPACGYEEAGAPKFCPNDGVALIDLGDPAVVAQGMICPSCRRGHAAGQKVCGTDGTELVPYALFVARGKHGAAKTRTCPTCGKSYPEQTTFCGSDGTPLPPPS